MSQMMKFAVIIDEPGYPKEPRAIAWIVDASSYEQAEAKALAHVGHQYGAGVEDVCQVKTLPKRRARRK
jgi:hypothetical protein